MLWVETLAGREARRVPMEASAEQADKIAQISPTNWSGCAQDDLEPILLGEARKHGADVRFGAELVSLAQDDAGVTATVLDRASDQRHEIRARYLIAADGVTSPVRHMLGIEQRGPGTLAHSIGIYFKADLHTLVQDRWFVLCFIGNANMRGLLLSVNNTGRWVLHVPYEPAQTTASAFTSERCIALARQAIGVPDLPVEILSVLPWEMAAGVADTFRVGNVFLAGDAAHVVPPTGAFGMNTGIQDAHNLAWKLAAVLRGAADPRLLDTYNAERRPVVQLTVEHIVKNEMPRFAPDHPAPDTAPSRASLKPDYVPPGSLSRTQERGSPQQSTAETGRPVDVLAVMLGYWYASAASTNPHREAPTLDALAKSGPVLDGREGARAPHVWLTQHEHQRSTLDLFGDRFVLMVGPDGRDWCRAFAEAAAQRNLPLDTYRIAAPGAGSDLTVSDDAWCAAYHLGDAGTVLVRPDGFVAWHCEGLGTWPEEVARTALDAALGFAKSQ
jgi:putative polyketide hydroxylase